MNPRPRPRPHPLPVLFALMFLSGCGGGDYPVDGAAQQAPAAELTSRALAVDPSGIAASAAAAVASAAVAPSPVAGRSLQPAQDDPPDADAAVAGPETDEAGQGAGRVGDRAGRDADASGRETG